MKWNIPAVKIDWLYKCLETVSKVDRKLYEDSDMSRSNEVKKEKVLEEYARKIAEEVWDPILKFEYVFRRVFKV